MTSDTSGIELFDPYRVGVRILIYDPWRGPTATEFIPFRDNAFSTTKGYPGNADIAEHAGSRPECHIVSLFLHAECVN